MSMDVNVDIESCDETTPVHRPSDTTSRDKNIKGHVKTTPAHRPADTISTDKNIKGHAKTTPAHRLSDTMYKDVDVDIESCDELFYSMITPIRRLSDTMSMDVNVDIESCDETTPVHRPSDTTSRDKNIKGHVKTTPAHRPSDTISTDKNIKGHAKTTPVHRPSDTTSMDKNIKGHVKTTPVHRPSDTTSMDKNIKGHAKVGVSSIPFSRSPEKEIPNSFEGVWVFPNLNNFMYHGGVGKLNTSNIRGCESISGPQNNPDTSFENVTLYYGSDNNSVTIHFEKIVELVRKTFYKDIIGFFRTDSLLYPELKELVYLEIDSTHSSTLVNTSRYLPMDNDDRILYRSRRHVVKTTFLELDAYALIMRCGDKFTILYQTMNKDCPFITAKENIQPRKRDQLNDVFNVQQLFTNLKMPSMHLVENDAVEQVRSNITHKYKPDEVMPTDQPHLKYIKSVKINRARRKQDITVTPEISPGMATLINIFRDSLIHHKKSDDPYDFENEVSDSSVLRENRKRSSVPREKNSKSAKRKKSMR